MRRYLFIAAVFTALCFWLARPLPYPRHFDVPLPSTAKLDKYGVVGLGMDVFYAFRFSFTDDQLRDQIIKSWDLSESSSPDDKVISFVHYKPPTWWPAESLKRMDERYELMVESEARYWNVWIDRKNNYLYAEYGKW